MMDKLYHFAFILIKQRTRKKILPVNFRLILFHLTIQFNTSSLYYKNFATPLTSLIFIKLGNHKRIVR